MNPSNWRYCPVWIADRPCCLRRLHNGEHLPYVVPRSMRRHPAGRAL